VNRACCFRGGRGRSTAVRQPREQWHTLLRQAHPGYIDWEEHEEKLCRLRENARAQGGVRGEGPPPEGPALLQGLAVCGICGNRMGVRYHVRGPSLVPVYLCGPQSNEPVEPPWQRIRGISVDAAIGQLLVETVTPVALEVALTVPAEIQSRELEADRLRRMRVERARYEAELAERRSMQVDPANRLVAGALEADGNQKLRNLEGARQEYERRKEADRGLLSEKQQEQILSLATDFPQLWHNPNTPDRERKRMVRLMVEDVTLIKRREITAQTVYGWWKLGLLKRHPYNQKGDCLYEPPGPEARVRKPGVKLGNRTSAGELDPHGCGYFGTTALESACSRFCSCWM